MFQDPGDFPFLTSLEQRWTGIRDECLALPGDSFEPWVQREMYGHGWSVYGFHAFGTPIPPALARCPLTAAALTLVPGLTTAGFSRLAPGAHITPHVGWVTTVYRAHLGLVIPRSCGLRVGDSRRQWVAGKALVFDDTTEHEAWNTSDEDRMVLLFDFLRPGQGAERRDEPPWQVRERLARLAKEAGPT
jgi:beta-hydroxylase